MDLMRDLDTQTHLREQVLFLKACVMEIVLSSFQWGLFFLSDMPLVN